MDYLRNRSLHCLVILLLAALLLSACNAVIPTPTPVPPTFTPTVPPPTETPMPTATQPPPTESPTITLSPTPTVPPPTETPMPTATQIIPTATPSGEDAIYIYYIQKPEGKGCGGTPIKVNTGIRRSGDVLQDVKTALSRLFAFHTLEWGNLYNALALSSISVGEVTVEGGELTVKLTGDLVRTEDACDNARMRAQVWSTMRQFPEFKSGHITVFLNSSLLGDLLEGK